jgi:ADP-ribose pyrophosphatase YjhB (NUDIX family)
MARHTRYQGFIIEDHKVLLIMHSSHTSDESYRVIPGGGIEGSETEEEFVIREMKEETDLDVKIDRLILDEPRSPEGGVYRWRKSYLCQPVSGDAQPGYEPEPEAAASYAISEVRWFDLRDERHWGEKLRQDPYTYPQLVQLRKRLGYILLIAFLFTKTEACSKTRSLLT